jgi:hypothetical protein
MAGKRDSVGWGLHRDWQRYSDVIFSLLAPVGHLPAAPFFTGLIAVVVVVGIAPEQV